MVLQNFTNQCPEDVYSKTVHHIVFDGYARPELAAASIAGPLNDEVLGPMSVLAKYMNTYEHNLKIG